MGYTGWAFTNSKFEEKKLVDILEIPIWNTFPSKHTSTIFIFCVRVHLGILFMLTKKL